MNIFIYSDESGVFDKVHNDIFVFGGVIFLGKDSRDKWFRKYASVEKTIYDAAKIPKNEELKAAILPNKFKNKIFRSLNQCYKFGVVINQQKVLDQIFKHKKDKQRYLDYAFKIGVKHAFVRLIDMSEINPAEVERIFFYNDEHTTATSGRYELEEALEREYKIGTYNGDYQKHYPPIFESLKEVNVEFCCSKSKLLIRAADIVANKCFFEARHGNVGSIMNDTFFIKFLP